MSEMGDKTLKVITPVDVVQKNNFLVRYCEDIEEMA